MIEEFAPEERRTILLAEYQEVCKSHAGITDFRAKLLAILPIASGAGYRDPDRVRRLLPRVRHSPGRLDRPLVEQAIERRGLVLEGMQQGGRRSNPQPLVEELVDLLLDHGERSNRQEVLRTLTESSVDPFGAVDRWS